jgi:hypothetical protein
MDPWLAETLLDVVAAVLLGVTGLWVLQGLLHAFGSGPPQPNTLAARRPPRSPTPPSAELSTVERSGPPTR